MSDTEEYSESLQIQRKFWGGIEGKSFSLWNHTCLSLQYASFQETWKTNGFGTERNGFQAFYFISIWLLVCWQCWVMKVANDFSYTVQVAFKLFTFEKSVPSDNLQGLFF